MRSGQRYSNVDFPEGVEACRKRQDLRKSRAVCPVVCITKTHILIYVKVCRVVSVSASTKTSRWKICWRLMEPKQAPTIRALYPNLSEDELAEAEQNLDQYLSLVLRIFERMELEKTNSLTRSEGTLSYGPTKQESSKQPLSCQKNMLDT